MNEIDLNKGAPLIEILRTPKVSEMELIEGPPLGEFFVSKRNGAACYELGITVPPGIRGIQPCLALYYTSLPNGKENLIGPGWDLLGLPVVKITGRSRYSQYGKGIHLTRDGSGSFIHYDLDGNKSTYVRQGAGGGKTLVIMKVEDPFGNSMTIDRDELGRPLRIFYGSEIQQDRSVDFSYDENRGRLEKIETRSAGNTVLIYQLTYDGEALRSVQQIAANSSPKAPFVARKPIKFKYEEVNGQVGNLSSITEITGLQINMTYSDIAGALSGYEVISAGPFQKRSVYSYLVQGSRLLRDAKGGAFLENLVVWNCSEALGSYWQYEAKGTLMGLLRAEGKIGNSQSKVPGGPATIPFAASSKEAGAYFYKISDIQYSYVKQGGTSEYLKSSEVTTTYVEPGVPLTPQTKRFDYDDDGLLVRLTGQKSVAIRDYIKGPGPGNPRFLKRSAFYDTTEDKKLKNASLLKDTVFDHDFDASNGKLVKIRLQTMIGSGFYSAPEISELSELGLPARVTYANGMIIQTTYDDNGFASVETLSSVRGKQAEKQTMVRDPAFGSLIYTKSMEGAICEQQQNPFGELTSVSGFDPSDPSSWKKDGKLIPLETTQTVFDSEFSALVTVQTGWGDKGEGRLETRTILDSLCRPVIHLKEIGGNKWTAQLIRYQSQHRTAQESLPFEITAKRKDLAKAIKSYKKGQVQWIGQFYDEFGRKNGTQYPDGSCQKIRYRLTSGKILEITRTDFDPDGNWGEPTTETMNDAGVVTSVRRGDETATTYFHDVQGQLIRMEDPLGQITEYDWNALGHCILEKNPITGERTARYGMSLQLEEETRNGTRTSYSYDWRGRPLEKAVNAGTKSEKKYRLTYKPDPENRSCSVVATHPDGWSVQTRTAPSGEEIERTIQLGPSYSETIKTDLHPSGDMHWRHYPDGRSLEYHFSGVGWTRSVNWQDEKLPLVSLAAQDHFGRPQEIRFSNGITEKRSFSEFGNLTGFWVGKEGASKKKALISQKFTHLPGFMGLVGSALDESGSNASARETYQYDKLGRLSSVTGEQGQVKDCFKYGVSGNIEEYDLSDGSYSRKSTKSLYQSLEITRDNQHFLSLTHDVDGHITTANHGNDEWAFFFGGEGKLEQFSTTNFGGSVGAEFVTDASGHRLIKAESDGRLTLYIDKDYQITRTRDGEVLSTVKVLTENGCLAEITEVLEGDQPLSPLFRDFKQNKDRISRQSVGGLVWGPPKPGTVFLHLDERGSTILATDIKGRSVATIAFNRYGKIDEEKSAGECFFDIVFAGMRLDTVSGLYYAGARYYHPEFMSFLSPDPARSSTDPYAYPHDPINNFDYNGACNFNNFCRAFTENFGRRSTSAGSALFTFIGCSLMFTLWDSAVFGYSDGLASRWGIAVGFWFTISIVLNGVLGCCNRSRRVICGRERRHSVGENEIGSIVTDFIRVGISTVVGTVWLGPLLCFIGNEEPYDGMIRVCSADYYGISAIRGAVASTSSGIMSVLLNRLARRYPFASNSLLMRYLTHMAVMCTSFFTWQSADLVLQHVAFGKLIPDIVAAKVSFFTGELVFAPFMAQPNLFLSLLPAVMSHSCFGGFRNFLFEPRAVFPEDHPDAGHYVPLLPADRAVVEVIDDDPLPAVAISMTSMDAPAEEGYDGDDEDE